MDQKLKQRLIGAAVLVTLGVIIIPELIKDPAGQDNPGIFKDPSRSEPASAKDTLAISLPSAKPPAPETAPKTAEQAPPPVTAPSAAAGPEPSAGQRENQAAGTLPEAKPHQEPPKPDAVTQQATTAQEPSAAKSKQPALPETRTAKATVPPSAKKLEPTKSSTPPKEARVAKAAVPASPKGTEPVKPSALPKDSRSSQDSNAGSAKKEPLKVKPAEPAEAPKIDVVTRSATPSQPGPASGRPNWTVQAGSFADREKALQLRAKLRDQQFPATLESVTLNDRTMYRVRVGAQTSRTESERVLTRMEQQLGVTGQIMVGDK